MQLTTKYNIGYFVWVINGKTGQIVEREIAGIRTQVINGTQSTMYSFLKDKFDPNSNYHDYLGYDPILPSEKYFWLNEEVCYKSKEELKNSL
ncbi:MAG: hypothetical protein QM660_10895 [Dysgonomonas sp.]